MANKYSYNGSRESGDWDELASWIPIIVLMVVGLWPIGLILLFRKLMGYSSNRRERREAWERAQRAARSAAQSARDAAQDAAQSVRDAAQSAARAGQSDWTAQPGAYHYRYTSTGQTGQGPKAAAPGMQGVDSRERDSKGRYMPKRKPVNLNRGKAMTVWGSIIAAIFAMASLAICGELASFFDVEMFFGALMPCLGFFGGGLVMAYSGRQRQKKAKRFRKYLTLIGKRESISIASLAQAMPVSVRTACDDLQEMLDEGMIPQGYLDMGTGRLVLNADGLQEEKPQPEAEPQPKPEDKSQDDDAILREIRTVNDAIADPDMSRKIDRIEEITGKILNYQKQNPAKAGELRSFLNYYLPTTLKILKAYAQMEAQGIEGENISAAKKRIEDMMDQVVSGFEKQLDKLFQNDALDISSDVAVLEKMLENDGLGSSGMTMGGV